MLVHKYMQMQRRYENKPAKEENIVEENSGLTMNNIPKIAINIAII